MKSFMILLSSALLVGQALAQDPKAPKPAAPKPAAAKTAASGELQTEEQKTLYAVGLWLGNRVTPLGLTSADLKYVTIGLKDAALGRKVQVDMSAYGPKINAFAQSRLTAKAQKEKDRSKAFLERAKKAPGAQVFPSGLIYTELKAGTGASPAATDTVKAHYQGALIDGKVFDNSYKRGEPVDFPLGSGPGRPISCFTEAILKMKVGGKAKLVCPSDIGYGDGGNPPAGILGGATLVFEVELVSINKLEAPKPVVVPPELGKPDAAKPEPQKPN